jgi:hypothetical protein
MESILFMATLGAVFVVAIWTIRAENAERKPTETKVKVVAGRRIPSSASKASHAVGPGQKPVTLDEG